MRDYLSPTKLKIISFFQFWTLKTFKFSRQVEERSREQINEDSEEEEEDTVNNVALASTTSTEVDAQAIEVKKNVCLFSDTYK